MHREPEKVDAERYGRDAELTRLEVDEVVNPPVKALADFREESLLRAVEIERARASGFLAVDLQVPEEFEQQV